MIKALENFKGHEEFEEDLQKRTSENLYGGPVSLAVFDIDQFLQINNNCGCEKGDGVIEVIAQIFRAEFAAEDDSLYRLGGDEFAVIQEGTEKEQTFLKMESARKALASWESFQHVNPLPTISAGVAAFPDDGRTKQEVLRKAEDALHRAKSSGKNKVILAREEKKIPKTSHYTQGQLERLSVLSGKEGVGEAELLREALDDLLKKYSS
ncbi:MAG: diguanylate cyclase [Spirochaetia bacterium]